MSDTLGIAPFDMILCLNDATDMVSPAVAGHQLRVAYIASRLAAELGLSQDAQNDVLTAGALHDIGALSLKEKLGTLQFDGRDLHRHADAGFHLLVKFGPFAKAASFVRFHHTYWGNRAGVRRGAEAVPMEAHLLHLADRVDVLLSREKEILGQIRPVCATIREHSGEMFVPEQVDALMKLAQRESFWLDIASPWLQPILAQRANFPSIALNLDTLMSLTNMFRQMIDFRSRYTATHSGGVAGAAEALAGFLGFSQEDCQRMRIAGYLHDLGKLSIPSEILEKPGPLSLEEMNLVRHHTYYGFRALQRVKCLDTVNAWASFHHERPDGQGYPFHLAGSELSQGSRIMAVADTFSALTEDRPYRSGIGGGRARQLLQRMADSSALDGTVVAAFTEHAEAIDVARALAFTASRKEYEDFAGAQGRPAGQ